MSSPVKIVGPFALAKDTAEALGVSESRAKRLRTIVTNLVKTRRRASGKSATAVGESSRHGAASHRTASASKIVADRHHAKTKRAARKK